MDAGYAGASPFVKYFALQSTEPARCRRYAAGATLKEVTELGKVLLWVGAGIVVLGFALVFAGKTGIPLGRLPGDFLYRGKNTTFYFPLATSLLLSVLLSVVLYLVGRFRR